jgi:hypothetical protein
VGLNDIGTRRDMMRGNATSSLISQIILDKKSLNQ